MKNAPSTSTAKLDFEIRTEKTTYHNPERWSDGSPGRSRKGEWLLLRGEGVEMCDVTVRMVWERANESLSCEMEEGETNVHGGKGRALTWCSTSLTLSRPFPL